MLMQLKVFIQQKKEANEVADKLFKKAQKRR